jgi:3-isopropylmalate dehydrogenase
MTHRARVAVIPGDGIGPEVIDAALPAIAAAAAIDGLAIEWERFPYGADHYLATGESLPEGTIERLQSEVDAILLGALGDPRIPDDCHARDILFGLRFGLDLFVNFRPIRLLHPDLCPLKGDTINIDMAIFRENTEGIYAGKGRSRDVGTPDEEQIAEEVHTAPKVTRIIDAAFVWSAETGRTRVTLCDKANAVPAHRIWQRLFDDIGERYPQIVREHRYVDALAMELVRDPTRFDVIVTNNLFGDILSDLAAQLVGGLGVAPSANVGTKPPGVFEPVHGSAPPLAGRGVANPIATILTGGLMLEHLGAVSGAVRLQDAVRESLTAGFRTPDLGGRATTAEVGERIAQTVKRL